MGDQGHSEEIAHYDGIDMTLIVWRDNDYYLGAEGIYSLLDDIYHLEDDLHSYEYNRHTFYPEFINAVEEAKVRREFDKQLLTILEDS